MPANMPGLDSLALLASSCVEDNAYSTDELLVLLWSSVVAGHSSHVLYDAIAVSVCWVKCRVH